MSDQPELKVMIKIEQSWSPEVELLSYFIRQRKLIMIWLIAVICYGLDRVSLKR
ncbi:MAG: hypothetical protein M3Z01_05530 [Thermoproteota archaeon]|nr:hypothetical protein [Thermoproteota archaeon]